MSAASSGTLILAVLVLALLVWRQLATRRLRENYRVSMILAVIGIIEFLNFLKGHPTDDGSIAVAVIGSVAIAAVTGAARALTIRVWRAGGDLLRKGTWLTALLWVISLAAHLGYDDLVTGHVAGSNGGSVGNATVILYLVVTLTIQQFILLRRVARQEAKGEIPVDGPRLT